MFKEHEASLDVDHSRGRENDTADSDGRRWRLE